MLTFKTLTAEELNPHRWTCPLEIGRYQIKGGVKNTLEWPLPIYLIWSEIDVWDKIGVSRIEEDGTKMNSVSVQEWSDWCLYTEEQDWVRYSITKVLD